MWDEIDIQILNAWGDLQETLCPKCGRPKTLHDSDQVTDYQIGFHTCTATQALDDWFTNWTNCSPLLPAQALADARADKRARERGSDPDRSRSWFTYRADETPA